MLTVQSIDRELEQITSAFTNRLIAEQIPGLEQVIGSRDSDRLHITAVFSDLPLEHRRCYFRLQSNMILEYPAVAFCFDTIRRQGQELSDVR